nr:cell wall hydrolase [Lachnospiraceae bacterium]
EDSYEGWYFITFTRGGKERSGYVSANPKYTQLVVELDTGYTLEEIEANKLENKIKAVLNASKHITSIPTVLRSEDQIAKLSAFTEADFMLMCYVVSLEADDQGEEGMLAVANVILNRYFNNNFDWGGSSYTITTADGVKYSYFPVADGKTSIFEIVFADGEYPACKIDKNGISLNVKIPAVVQTAVGDAMFNEDGTPYKNSEKIYKLTEADIFLLEYVIYCEKYLDNPKLGYSEARFFARKILDKYIANTYDWGATPFILQSHNPQNGEEFVYYYAPVKDKQSSIYEVLFAPNQFCTGASGSAAKRAKDILDRGFSPEVISAVTRALKGYNNIGDYVYFRMDNSASNYLTYESFYILNAPGGSNAYEREYETDRKHGRLIGHIFYEKIWGKK